MWVYHYRTEVDPRHEETACPAGHSGCSRNVMHIHDFTTDNQTNVRGMEDAFRLDEPRTAVRAIWQRCSRDAVMSNAAGKLWNVNS